MPKFKFSWKITAVCLMLMIVFLRLAYWQWTRHIEKKALINTLHNRLRLEAISNEQLLNSHNYQELIFRKANIFGEYDFSKQILLRNRRLHEIPGVHVITPFKLENTNNYVLINRGFLPLKLINQGNKILNPIGTQNLLVLIKASDRRKIFAPKDPLPGKDQAWVKEWLRVDIKSIQKQMPYNLLSVWGELVSDQSNSKIEQALVTSSSGKEEILSLGLRADNLNQKIAMPDNLESYPIAVFNTYLPPGRHFGYVFEWSFMALITLAVALVLQLRR